MTVPRSPSRPHDSVSRHHATWLALWSVALAVVFVLSLGFGRYPVAGSTVARILWALVSGASDAHAAGASDSEWIVVSVVRLPRVTLVTLCGMGLALSGATLQGLFRNPLVGPEVVGVTAGASLGGVLAIVGSAPMFGIVGSALVGGVAALVLAYTLARLAGGGTLALVLAGVIVGAFFASLVGLAQYLADPALKLPNIVYWLLGSFTAADGSKVWVMGVACATAGSLLLALRWRINVLSLGDVEAAALGLPVAALRALIVACVGLLVAAQVSVSGGIGWVGLVVPHFARMWVGPDHRVLLPTSALLGGIFLLVMDDAARTLTAQEIPIGLLTTLLGTPIFAYMLYKSQARGWMRE